MGMDYKSAGVDVTAGYKAVELMRSAVKSTFTEGILSDIGGFGGMFSLGQLNMEEPVLVSGTDGVGTKLKIAFLLDKHDTVGIDCVAMCVNDIVCCGAKPLFFLDYIACGKNIPEKIAGIVKGVAEGCIASGAAITGGETAEMPGFYPEDEYDLAGFAVGIVDKKNIINGSDIKEGDVIIGIASSGVHSNGFSLVRKVFNPSKESLNEFIPELKATLGETLITPTKIYVKPVLKLMCDFKLKGLSHITGGGFIENIPRCIPKEKGLTARIFEGSWPILPIFSLIEEKGGVKRMDMYNTFNMGIGMVIVMDKDDVSAAVKALNAEGEAAYIIGDIIKGEEEVKICLK